MLPENVGVIDGDQVRARFLAFGGRLHWVRLDNLTAKRWDVSQLSAASVIASTSFIETIVPWVVFVLAILFLFSVSGRGGGGPPAVNSFGDLIVVAVIALVPTGIAWFLTRMIAGGRRRRIAAIDRLIAEARGR